MNWLRLWKPPDAPLAVVSLVQSSIGSGIFLQGPDTKMIKRINITDLASLPTTERNYNKSQTWEILHSLPTCQARWKNYEKWGVQSSSFHHFGETRIELAKIRRLSIEHIAAIEPTKRRDTSSCKGHICKSLVSNLNAPFIATGNQ